MNYRYHIIVSISIIGAFIAGHITGHRANVVFATDEPAEFGIFWEAWEIVNEHFVERNRIDFQAMTHGAIRGMLTSLGDENHTVFFTAAEAEQQNSSMEGSIEGIGAYVSQENGFFRIVAPILGSPAESAGIQAGDLVIAVDGEEIAGQPQWEVISKIRGTAGTAVTLTVIHPDETEPADIEIIRSRVDIPSVLWSPIPNTDYIYLQITQFAADTNQELIKALEKIQNVEENGNPINGILLDLRNNPGGFLRQALLVGSHFLEEGAIILHERDAQGNVSSYRANGPGLARTYPIVVLINEGSASAAEILLGSLRENGRAKLIGETTLGTGTVLRPYTLSDGSVIRLGVRNWLTPNMKLIKDRGITPNVTVKLPASIKMVDTRLLQEIDAETLKRHDDRQFAMGLLYLKLTAKLQQHSRNH
ncbi:S41 family peptidase [Chloroflexi bacterium TSY]|nr:S41 family peptidase [Chloroflexi bacterium TSY]